MAKQINFYSVTDMPASPNEAGIYFKNGGELYKGSKRFGAGKVWTTKPAENAGVIAGDMYINNGVAEVFNGSAWVSIVDPTTGLNTKASIGSSATTAQHGVSTAISLYSS